VAAGACKFLPLGGPTRGYAVRAAPTELSPRRSRVDLDQAIAWLFPLAVIHSVGIWSHSMRAHQIMTQQVIRDPHRRGRK
jgi:hypothetical protein